jgi:hypothetical protein
MARSARQARRLAASELYARYAALAKDNGYRPLSVDLTPQVWYNIKVKALRLVERRTQQ